MWRKRHLSSCRRRVRRLLAWSLPLKIASIRLRELALQTIRGFSLCPPYLGTAPLLGSGNRVARSGCATAPLAKAAKDPSSTRSVHTLLIRTATYTISQALQSSAMRPRLAGLLAALMLLLIPASASAAPRVQHLKFKYGPVTIKPGQNTISLDGDGVPKPKRPGWIVGFRPDLERANGEIPRVDVLHLHHAVWLINGRLTFAAGEEKTNVRLPKGFGWRHEPGDRWVLNHMIHNLLPNRDRVYITYTLDFIPDASPAARGIRRVNTRWLDV